MTAVFIALLPAGVTLSLVMSRWTEADAKTRQEEILAQTRSLVDTFMEAIERTGFSIAINADVSRAILLPWRADRDFQLLIRVNRILAERVNSTPFLDSIILYSPENQKVMANFGVADADLFHDQALIKEASAVRTGTAWLRTRTTARGELDTRDILSFVIRLPLNQSVSRGLLILNVHEELLFSSVVSPNSSILGSIFILDDEGFIISAADKKRIGRRYAQAPMTEVFPAAAASFVSADQSRKILTTYLRDPIRGWIYVTERDADAVYAKARAVLVATISISIVCLLFGFAFSFPLSRSGWKPVQAELERSRDLLREHVVAGLLSGRFFSETEFRRECREYGLPLETGPYQVLIAVAYDPTAIIGADAGDQALLAGQLLKWAQQTLELTRRDAGIHGVATIVGQGEIAVILAPIDDAPNGFIDRFLSTAGGAASAGILFYAGRMCDAFDQIHRSYEEARVAADAADSNADIDQEPKSENRADETVQRIKDYLSIHFDQQIDLSTMAEKVYVSPPYLCKLFKKATGSTYFEYLTLIRVERAKRLLKETALPIHTIAERTGFLNKRNIGRAFHKFLGMTPSDYRADCAAANLSCTDGASD